MDNNILREWQECWYEIGLKSVMSQLTPLQYAINDLREQISKIGGSKRSIEIF